MSAQLCPILWDTMDCSLTVSYDHGIFQARILEWVVIYPSRGSSQPRDQTHVSCNYCISDRFFSKNYRGIPGYSPWSLKEWDTPEHSTQQSGTNGCLLWITVLRLTGTILWFCHCLLGWAGFEDNPMWREQHKQIAIYQIRGHIWRGE